jgi:hypothetical protein
MLHGTLKSCGGITQAKTHTRALKQSIFCSESRFLAIVVSDPDLPVA